MNLDEILRIIETSPLGEASKQAISEIVEKARPQGSLSEEEQEQILAIFELEEKESQFTRDSYQQEAENLETYLRGLDDAVEEALKEVEQLDKDASEPRTDA